MNVLSAATSQNLTAIVETGNSYLRTQYYQLEAVL